MYRLRRKDPCKRGTARHLRRLRGNCFFPFAHSLGQQFSPPHRRCFLLDTKAVSVTLISYSLPLPRCCSTLFDAVLIFGKRASDDGIVFGSICEGTCSKTCFSRQLPRNSFIRTLGLLRRPIALGASCRHFGAPSDGADPPSSRTLCKSRKKIFGSCGGNRASLLTRGVIRGSQGHIPSQALSISFHCTRRYE